MNISKKNLTPIALVSIFLLMLGLSFAAVPLYDLFCIVTGFGGTTQNATDKEIPKIIVNQDYKMRFDTNINSTLNWKFTSNFICGYRLYRKQHGIGIHFCIILETPWLNDLGIKVLNLGYPIGFPRILI